MWPMDTSTFRRQRVARQLVVAALTLCIAPSCGRTIYRPQLDDAVAAMESNVILHVENHAAAAATISAVTQGTWKYVGSVGARSSDSFELYELELTGAPLRLRASLTGRPDTVYSPPLAVAPGQTVTFTIERELALSSAAVH